MSETLDVLRSPSVPRDLGRIEYAYRITVGGLSFDRCDAADVDYDASGSGSCRVVITDDGLLRAARGEKIRAEFLTEDTDGFFEYFSGEVRYAAHDPETGRTTLEAFGPKEALTATFNEPVLYRGTSLSSMVSDIRRRLGPKLPRTRVIGGQRVRVQDTTYNREVELGEALEDVTESVGYLVADRPGYVLLVAPTPRTGEPVEGERTVRLGPTDHGPGGLKIEPVEEGSYYAVGAFRREEGREVWSLTVKVRGAERRGAHPADVKWLPDFEGDYATAKQQCYALAEAYSRGRFRGNGRGMTVYPVFPSTALRVAEDEVRRDDEYRVVERIRRVYGASCESVSVNLVAGEMDLSFRAELRRTKRVLARTPIPGLSPHVISSEAVEVNNVDTDGFGGYFVVPPVVPEGEIAWYGGDEIGGYVDMDAAEDRAGVDERGAWVDRDA